MNEDIGRRTILSGLGVGAAALATGATPAVAASSSTPATRSLIAKGEATIAYLQSELQLSAGQLASSSWLSVVGVLRQNAAHRDTEQQMAVSGPHDAISYLDMKLKQGSAVLNDSNAFRRVFAPFSSTLSSAQQAIADLVFNPQNDF